MSVQIEEKDITIKNNYLDPVTYIPQHANGKMDHPSVELGVIINVMPTTIGVLYCKSRTVQQTNPKDLVWG